MLRSVAVLALSCVGIAVTACDDSRVLGPESGAESVDEHRVGLGGAGPITVMTRNVYVGADLDPIIDAAAAGQPIDQPLSEALLQFQATNFVERSAALADEIAEHDPDVVGLQEITRLAVGPDVIEFLPIILAQLQARGADYRVAGIVQNSDVVLGPVEFTDFDVILARRDVGISNVRVQNYAAKLEAIPGVIEVLRGFVAVDATIRGRTYRMVNTHLEVSGFAPIQEAQAGELLAILNQEVEANGHPIVLLGDLNSRHDRSTTTTYGLFVDNGWVDVWNRVRGRARRQSGLTCCHDDDLRNEVAQFDRRIDYILVLNPLVRAPKHAVGPVRGEVIGDEPGDRTPNGLWPSDHGGVVAKFRVRRSPMVARH